MTGPEHSMKTRTIQILSAGKVPNFKRVIPEHPAEELRDSFYSLSVHTSTHPHRQLLNHECVRGFVNRTVGGLTSKEVRSPHCSWHSVGWAEAMLQIWTTEVLLSRALLWGGECLVDEQQLLRRMTPPHLCQILHNPGTECLRVFRLFGFDGYRTNSSLKRVKVQSEVAFLEHRHKELSVQMSILNNAAVKSEAWVETGRNRPTQDLLCWTVAVIIP